MEDCWRWLVARLGRRVRTPVTAGGSSVLRAPVSCSGVLRAPVSCSGLPCAPVCERCEPRQQPVTPRLPQRVRFVYFDVSSQSLCPACLFAPAYVRSGLNPYLPA